MAQQTAVDWFSENIQKVHKMDWDIVFIQAKEMEKEQIKNSFNDGYCKGDEELSWDDIEKYYNETYNK